MQHLHIEIGNIVESTLNNRGPITDESVAELAADMNVVGLINPITVRTSIKSPGKYEVIAGSRRYRAALLLKWKSIPATFRDCNDDEAFEIMVIENLQRENIHPMDEAIAFSTLVSKSDIKTVSARIGKDVQYIARRLKLNDLIRDAVTLFRDGELEIGHCMEICRLTPADQKRVVEWMQSQSQTFLPAGGGTVTTKYFKPVKALQHFIKTEIIHSLIGVPFDLLDEKLYPKAGACKTCAKRSGANADLFGDIQKADVCFDGACMRIKIDISVNAAIRALTDDGVDVYGVVPSYGVGEEARNRFKGLKLILNTSQYHEIKSVKKNEPATGDTAIFIDGPRIGEIIRIKRIDKTETKRIDKTKLPVNVQVKELEEKKKRGVELDRQRVFEPVVKLILENPAFRSTALPAKQIGIGLPETVLMIYCILDKWTGLNYDNVKKLLGIDIHENIDTKKLADKIFAFSKDAKRWNQFIRLFIMSELGSRNVERNPFVHDMMLQVARFHMIDVEKIVKDQLIVRNRRDERIDRHLKELKKPAGKKVAGKKAVKKPAKKTNKKPRG